MVDRRSFLIGTVALGLTQSLLGCGDRAASLKVLLLQGSIPPQLLGAFKKQLVGTQAISLKPQSQLKDLFELLQAWQKKATQPKNLLDRLPLISRNPATADLLTLGDTWLSRSIQAQLIRPFGDKELSGWQQLPPRWQTLVRRNPQGQIDENGQIWGAPYRWGTTLIAYHQDKLEQAGIELTDWQDLWNPKLRDRISMLDQPREVIGLTLKKLGYSYNSTDFSQISQLKTELLSLQQQVKYYSSQYYLQPLILEDVWVAVGWSSDILPLLANNPEIKAIVPRSGTSLWADVWVRPASEKAETQLSELAQKWINFCWQPEAVNQISLFTDAASPAILTIKQAELSSDVRQNPLLNIDSSILDRCEFLYPLPETVQQQYEDLWRTMREQVRKRPLIPIKL